MFKTVLVIGNNHEDIIKKYSQDTKVEEYVVAKYDDKDKLRKNILHELEKIMSCKNKNTDEQYLKIINSKYLEIKEMSDFEYFMEATKGCHYDEETGDALSCINPNAHYKYEKCYQKLLLKYGDDGEGTFSNPFYLKDGTKSYSAPKGEIDWKRMHLYNTSLYEAAWDIVVNKKNPQTDEEKIIQKNMSNKTKYFSNFRDKDEYVKYSCSFWCYGVATDSFYKELDDNTKSQDWINSFYENYIVPLSDDTILTIYEAKSIEE